jgi:DNA-binding MarR family transcriptional regulator
MSDATLRLNAFLPFRLSITSNLISEIVATTYQSLFNLRIPEWRVIAVVAEHEGISPQEVGRISCMDKVTVSRAASALLARKLLTRQSNDSDGRSHLLRLSASGQDLYSAVAPKALELERRIFESLDQQELSAFVATLAKIETIANDTRTALFS